MTWTARDILAALPYATGESSSAVLTAIVTDTREPLQGALFVPLRGERFDGHDFVGQALERGAALALWAHPELPADLPPERLVRVPDTLAAYQDLARYHLLRLAVPVVAVTGSAGKTTTKDLCAAVLSGRLRVHRTHANYNNEVGVPRTLLELREDHQAAVLELAMRGPGQIAQLARLLQARVGLVTCIGESHHEFLGSLEAIADAKGELLEQLAPHGVAVLPAECPFLDRLRERAGGRRVLTFSARGPADVRVTEARSLGLEGWEAVVAGPQGAASFHLSLAGLHNLANLAAAVAAASVLGLSAEECRRGLAGFTASPLRMEIHHLPDGTTVINDSYNAAPASMQGALEVLAGVETRRVAVLGDMLELGSIEEECHGRVGRLAAEAGLDLLLAVGERSRHLAESARQAGLEAVLWAPDREAAWEILRREVRPGDTVLLKASRGVGLDRLADLLRSEVGVT